LKSKEIAACLLGAAALPATLCQPAFPDELLISTAISMKEALQEIAANFQKQHPHMQVIVNSASSGALSQQIEAGAPVDIFVSASKIEIEELEKRHLLAAPPRAFAFNKLVCVTYGANAKVRSLEDLLSVERVAIGNPQTVPAGRYAVQALSKAKILDVLETGHKLVYAENVRAVLSYVEQNNVDAGIVYESDALTSHKAHIACRIPKESSEPISYYIVPIRRSHNLPLACEFIKYSGGEQARSALIGHHFETNCK
jgi:molybdate transport system substrate-binding protein